MTENPLDYSFVFEKEGKFNDLWLAATNERRFNQKNKRNISQFDIFDICKSIEADILGIKEVTPAQKPEENGPKRKRRGPPKKKPRIDSTENPEKPECAAFSLKLASNLMMGAVRIWRYQVNQLYEDSKLAVSKQASYHAIMHAQSVEEERRKERINYAAMMDTEDRTKKKTKNATKLTLNEFEQFEEDIRNNNVQNKVDELTLNTAQVDQITLRETHLSSFALPANHEINFADFEPLREDEFNALFEKEPPVIDEVRDNPREIQVSSEILPEIEFSVPISMNESAEKEIPAAIEVNEVPQMEVVMPTIEPQIEVAVPEQQPMVVDEVMEELPPLEKDVNVVKRRKFNKKVTEMEINNSFDVPMEELPPELDVQHPPVPETQPEDDDNALKLQKLDKNALKKAPKSKPKAKKGTKRKIDDVTKLSYTEMTKQLKDTSDIVHANKLSIMPPLKKFRIQAVGVYFHRSSHSFRDYLSPTLVQTFSVKVKFLSLNEATKKRKLKAAAKGGPAKKKQRTEKQVVEIPPESAPLNVAEFVQTQVIDAFPPISVPQEPCQEFVQPEIPVETVPAPQNVEIPPQETFMPGFENILNELIEEEQNLVTNEEENPAAKSQEDSHWRQIKQDWGQASVLKKMIAYLRKKEQDFSTIEILMENDGSRKVGAVTFSSLIHLKAKKYLALEKNAKLEVIRIREGPKLTKFLSQFT